jgi:serine kinase of HPr protein (carbohydrate metabolism regulator)
MKLEEIVRKLDLEVVSGEENLDREVTRGYASDLMSDVIANAGKSDIWVTLQTHLNIVAVASMKELAGIVLINGRRPEPETLKRAVQEEMPILISPLPTFEVVGRLYSYGITGMKG